MLVTLWSLRGSLRKLLNEFVGTGHGYTKKVGRLLDGVGYSMLLACYQHANRKTHLCLCVLFTSRIAGNIEQFAHHSRDNCLES